MIQPSFAEFQRLSKQGNLIPVYDVFSADLLTPVSAYLRIAQGARHSFLLESVEGGENIARYTFAGAHPVELFRYAAGACVMESRDRLVWEERDPVSFLRERMQRFRPVRLPGLPPLVAGAIGYFSYDMVRLIERLPKRLRDEIGLYDAMLMFYHGLIAFDHVQHRLWIVQNVFTEGPDGNLRAKYDAAVREIKRTRKLLEQPVEAERPRTERSPKKRSRLKIASNFRRGEYLDAVRKAKSYIRAGDIFQVVLSQRFSAKTKAAPFDVYRELRALNPSPYLFYLHLNDVAVVGSSPEMLVKVQGRDVFYRPIAGTLPRGMYEGGVLYMDFAGNLDSCIALRTMVVKNGAAHVQAGGGIVADSTPEGEYQESVNKSRALLAALEAAHGARRSR